MWDLDIVEVDPRNAGDSERVRLAVVAIRSNLSHTAVFRRRSRQCHAAVYYYQWVGMA